MHPFVYFELTKNEAFGPYSSLCVRYPDDSKNTYLPRDVVSKPHFKNDILKSTRPEAILQSIIKVLKNPKELVILVRNSIDASVCQEIFFPTKKSLSQFKIPVYFHLMSTKERMKSMSELRSEVIEQKHGLSCFKGLPIINVLLGKTLLNENKVDVIFLEFQALTDTEDIKLSSNMLLQRIALCGIDGIKPFKWEFPTKFFMLPTQMEWSLGNEEGLAIEKLLLDGINRRKKPVVLVCKNLNFLRYFLGKIFHCPGNGKTLLKDLERLQSVYLMARPPCDDILSASEYVKKASAMLKFPLNLLKINDMNLKNTPCFQKIDAKESYFKQKSWLESHTLIKGSDLIEQPKQRSAEKASDYRKEEIDKHSNSKHYPRNEDMERKKLKKDALDKYEKVFADSPERDTTPSLTPSPEDKVSRSKSLTRLTSRSASQPSNAPSSSRRDSTPILSPMAAQRFSPITNETTPITSDSRGSTPITSPITSDSRGSTPITSPITSDSTPITSDSRGFTPISSPITSDSTPRLPQVTGDSMPLTTNYLLHEPFDSHDQSMQDQEIDSTDKLSKVANTEESDEEALVLNDPNLVQEFDDFENNLAVVSTNQKKSPKDLKSKSKSSSNFQVNVKKNPVVHKKTKNSESETKIYEEIGNKNKDQVLPNEIQSISPDMVEPKSHQICQDSSTDEQQWINPQKLQEISKNSPNTSTKYFPRCPHSQVQTLKVLGDTLIPPNSTIEISVKPDERAGFCIRNNHVVVFQETNRMKKCKIEFVSKNIPIKDVMKISVKNLKHREQRNFLPGHISAKCVSVSQPDVTSTETENKHENEVQREVQIVQSPKVKIKQCNRVHTLNLLTDIRVPANTISQITLLAKNTNEANFCIENNHIVELWSDFASSGIILANPLENTILKKVMKVSLKNSSRGVFRHFTNSESFMKAKCVNGKAEECSQMLINVQQSKVANPFNLQEKLLQKQPITNIRKHILPTPTDFNVHEEPTCNEIPSKGLLTPKHVFEDGKVKINLLNNLQKCTMLGDVAEGHQTNLKDQQAEVSDYQDQIPKQHEEPICHETLTKAPSKGSMRSKINLNDYQAEVLNSSDYQDQMIQQNDQPICNETAIASKKEQCSQNHVLELLEDINVPGQTTVQISVATNSSALSCIEKKHTVYLKLKLDIKSVVLKFDIVVLEKFMTITLHNPNTFDFLLKKQYSSVITARCIDPEMFCLKFKDQRNDIDSQQSAESSIAIHSQNQIPKDNNETATAATPSIFGQATSVSSETSAPAAVFGTSSTIYGNKPSETSKTNIFAPTAATSESQETKDFSASKACQQLICQKEAESCKIIHSFDQIPRDDKEIDSHETPKMNSKKQCHHDHILKLQKSTNISAKSTADIQVTPRSKAANCIKNQHTVKITLPKNFSLQLKSSFLMIIEKDMKITVHNPKSFDQEAPFWIGAKCEGKIDHPTSSISGGGSPNVTSSVDPADRKAVESPKSIIGGLNLSTTSNNLFGGSSTAFLTTPSLFGGFTSSTTTAATPSVFGQTTSGSGESSAPAAVFGTSLTILGSKPSETYTFVPTTAADTPEEQQNSSSVQEQEITQEIIFPSKTSEVLTRSKKTLEVTSTEDAKPLFLSETHLYFSRAFKPTGPWRVSLPESSSNKSYKVQQTDEEISEFGSIAQSTLISNSIGISYVTMKPNLCTKSFAFYNRKKKIGSVKLTRKTNCRDTTSCCARYELVTCSKVTFGIGESKHVYCELPKNLIVNKPICVTEYHGVNINPYLLFLSVLAKDSRAHRTVLMTGQSFQFKNNHNTPITIEAGQKIAYADCCHGHYEDSSCFYSENVSHPIY